MPARSGVTMRTHDVFAIAHNLAARLGHSEVTSVHILLAILREGRSPAVLALHNRGVRLKALEQDLEQHLPRSTAAFEADHVWTASDVAILHNAADEARELGHEYQGCEHILLAMLRDPQSVPAVVLARHEVRFRDARAEVLRILGSPLSDNVDDLAG
ncbi:MAG TPA: Clp protease N-terminal domain-containing protein [Gemmatimonadaceae bacterium]|nr:Clp protease N-terminal domain-containing protein [Gemmatimonadaceae bacterium]